jgi:predicted PurR-regulated permease PerM
MLPFKPQKQYTTIAVYTAATIAVVILLAVSLFNIANIRAWFAGIFSALSPLVYGLIFAYLLRPLVKRFEKLFCKLFKVNKRETETGMRRADAIARGTAILASFLCVFAFVFAFVVNLAMQRRLRAVSMTESLKSVE